MATNDYSAAHYPYLYFGGGKNDWFLPSLDELIELYSMRGVIGGFREDNYWSSTEASDSDPDPDPDKAAAWNFGINSEININLFRTTDYAYVRPIRAF
jgi:hypothetical protein